MTAKPADPCTAFLERLNGVLDGDETANTLLADGHFATCETCRLRFTAAKKLAAYRPSIPSPPAGFASTVTAIAIQDQYTQRYQRRMVQASFVALAASVAVGFWLLWPSTVTIPQNPPLAATTPGRVTKPFNEARDAVVSLSNKVADETLTPAANLFALGVDKPKPMPDTQPAADPLGDLPDAARAGFEPLVSTPRRALNLFIRDVGGVASSRKSNS
jgi:hypothetical protein